MSGDEREATSRERGYILVLTCASHTAILGAEPAASRLLVPAFGTSLLVWSAISGLMPIDLTPGHLPRGRPSSVLLGLRFICMHLFGMATVTSRAA